MSNDFIWENEEIRDLFVAGVFEHGGGWQEEAKAVFDRWLAAHDAGIRTAALEEAADQWSEWETFRASDGIISIRQHGQTVSEWLRNRAARV